MEEFLSLEGAQFSVFKKKVNKIKQPSNLHEIVNLAGYVGR